jgi:hypothetical protein
MLTDAVLSDSRTFHLSIHAAESTIALLTAKPWGDREQGMKLIQGKLLDSGRTVRIQGTFGIVYGTFGIVRGTFGIM